MEVIISLVYIIRNPSVNTACSSTRGRYHCRAELFVVFDFLREIVNRVQLYPHLPAGLGAKCKWFPELGNAGIALRRSDGLSGQLGVQRLVQHLLNHIWE